MLYFVLYFSGFRDREPQRGSQDETKGLQDGVGQEYPTRGTGTPEGTSEVAREYVERL